MRILVTLKGNIIIKEINRNNLENNSFNGIPFLRRYNSNQNSKILKIPKITKFISSKQNNFSNNSINLFTPRNQNNSSIKRFLEKDDCISSSFNLSDNSISLFQKPKYIKLHIQKLSVPKQFSDKYEKDTTKSTAIINSNLNYYMPTISLKTNPPSTSFSDKTRYYSLSDIIPYKNILEMRKTIIKENKEKEKDIKISNYNFRSKINSEKELEKFNSFISSPKIKSNKFGLIKYLNEKKIGPKALKSLYNKNNIKINKVNELCKFYFINKEKIKQLNDYKKLKEKKQFSINDLNIKDAEEKISEFKTKLEKYNIKVNKKEKHRNLLLEIKNKYWKRYNFDRINNKFINISIF